MKNYPHKLWEQGYVDFAYQQNTAQVSRDPTSSLSNAKSSHDKLVLPYSHLYYEGMKVAEYTVPSNSDGQS